MAESPGNKADPLWTAEEVAAYLRISDNTVNQWAKIGRIPVVKVGSLNRFRKSVIDRWLEMNERTLEQMVADATEGNAA